MKQLTRRCQPHTFRCQRPVMVPTETVAARAIRAISRRVMSLLGAVPADQVIARPGRVAQAVVPIPQRLVTDHLSSVGQRLKQGTFLGKRVVRFTTWSGSWRNLITARSRMKNFLSDSTKTTCPNNSAPLQERIRKTFQLVPRK